MAVVSLLLDLANILGGLLLATPLLRRLPSIGAGIGRAADRVAPWGWIIGVVALVTGGFYLLVHIFSGPRLFHFEIVAIVVGVLLAWERLTTRRPIAAAARHGEPSGTTLVIAVFGIIAFVVGIQGLLTPG